MLPEPKHREVILKHCVSEAYFQLVQKGWQGLDVAAEFERLGRAERERFENFAAKIKEDR